MSAVSTFDMDEYRARVERAHLVPPAPPDGLPPARRASDLPDPEPIRWLVEEVWPVGEIGLLVGDGGAFKSTVAIHLACAIAGGHKVFDEFQTIKSPVLIVSAEDHQDVVLMRARAICRGHGWPMSTLDNVYIIAEGAPSVADGTWCKHLAAEVARLRPGLIVLDPWAEMMGGDENSNTDARPAIKYLRWLARTVNAALALVHHAGKMREGGRALDRIRGASALPSAARVVFFFDFTEDGLNVENLKQSRAPRLAPFRLHQEIKSAPGNKAEWLSARFTRRRSESPLVGNILAQLMHAPGGERSFNDLAELLSVRRTTLRLALDDMVNRHQIAVREGQRGALFYRRILPADAHFDDVFPPDSGPENRPVPTGSGAREPVEGAANAPHASSHVDLVPTPTAPPLKGGAGGNQSRGGGASPPESSEIIGELSGLVPTDIADREPVERADSEPTGSGAREPVERADPEHQSGADPEALNERLEERRGLQAPDPEDS